MIRYFYLAHRWGSNKYEYFGNKGHEGVLHIPQSSMIEALSSDCLVSYPKNLLGVEVLALCSDAVRVFYWPLTDRAQSIRVYASPFNYLKENC